MNGREPQPGVPAGVVGRLLKSQGVPSALVGYLPDKTSLLRAVWGVRGRVAGRPLHPRGVRAAVRGVQQECRGVEISAGNRIARTRRFGT